MFLLKTVTKGTYSPPLLPYMVNIHEIVKHFFEFYSTQDRMFFVDRHARTEYDFFGSGGMRFNTFPPITPGKGKSPERDKHRLCVLLPK